MTVDIHCHCRQMAYNTKICWMHTANTQTHVERTESQRAWERFLPINQPTFHYIFIFPEHYDSNAFPLPFGMLLAAQTGSMMLFCNLKLHYGDDSLSNFKAHTHTASNATGITNATTTATITATASADHFANGGASRYVCRWTNPPHKKTMFSKNALLDMNANEATIMAMVKM